MSTPSSSRAALEKTPVHLNYACFICGVILSSSKTCIKHIEKIHRYIIPSRQGRRPIHEQYSYTPDRNGTFTIEEYACPSCWFHSPYADLETLNEHVRSEHDPLRIKMTEDEFTGKFVAIVDELMVLLRNTFMK
ncbi:hypothetical protein BD770DRAFT_452558 [Pilaira anomala]|nr:hypothetical protein BD770DRAFT_452558 [Pilaira anomala]